MKILKFIVLILFICGCSKPLEPLNGKWAASKINNIYVLNSEANFNMTLKEFNGIVTGDGSFGETYYKIIGTEEKNTVGLIIVEESPEGTSGIFEGQLLDNVLFGKLMFENQEIEIIFTKTN